MKFNILIQNGHVIDPANNIDTLKDIMVSNGYIVNSNSMQPDLVIDAAGKYVFPGLIDYHAHVFSKGTELGIDPDISMLNQGVTSVVDAGSAGVGSLEMFIENFICRSKMNIQAYINLCPAGLITMKYHEDFNPKFWDEGCLREFFEKYPGILLGLKIRISKSIFGSLDFEVVEKAVSLADKLKVKLCVHSTDPVAGMARLANILRPGDILAHCYHGTGDTIIDDDGHVIPEIKEAQKRGVIMDAANGSNHWSFATAEAAMADEFYPNVISTDLSCKTLYKDPVFSLPYIMSKYLMLGMPLNEIIKAVTVTPSSLMHNKKGLGSLTIGAEGNVSIFDIVEKDITFSDTQKRIRNGKQALVPLLTICKGEVVYRSITF